MLTENEINKLRESSKKTRMNIVKMVHAAKSGHPGGSLSGADILNVLYAKCLNIPKEWSKSPDFGTNGGFGSLVLFESGSVTSTRPFSEQP